VKKFEAGPKAKDADWHTMMILAQAATFDPDPSQFYGIRLPVDPHTCEIIQESWANWLRWDPLRMADRGEHQDSLRSMKALYIDCGDIDQYNLVYGSRLLHRKLEAAGISHTYEEFHDNHSSVDYRMDISLPFLAKALA
jgi:S-formylglutathione hydrolase FrmB